MEQKPEPTYTREQVEGEFMDEVWDALKADASDLRKQQRILAAFRRAIDINAVMEGNMAQDKSNACKHERGDFLKDVGYWICSGCWEKMPKRPQRVAMVDIEWVEETPTKTRQDVVWQSEIHVDEFGNSLGSFLRSMAKRFRMKTRPKMDLDAAYNLAIAVTQDFGDDFGDPSYDWSRVGAWEIADEEMSYFEDATGGSNG